MRERIMDIPTCRNCSLCKNRRKKGLLMCKLDGSEHSDRYQCAEHIWVRGLSAMADWCRKNEARRARGFPCEPASW